jgi:hypothetical protein
MRVCGCGPSPGRQARLARCVVGRHRCVQRAIDADGRQLFLLKGGTLLQHRLPATARPTKDVDGLVRGDLDAFFLALEDALAEPWGSLTLRRGEVEVVRPAGPRHPRRDRHALSDCAEDPRGL